MALGERLRTLRRRNGLSIAAAAQQAGIAKSYLSNLERDRATNPSDAVLMRLAAVLGTTLPSLLDPPESPAAHDVSPSLREFAQEQQLSDEEVQMLAQIRYRGIYPATIEDYKFLFEAIRRSTVYRDVQGDR